MQRGRLLCFFCFRLWIFVVEWSVREDPGNTGGQDDGLGDVSMSVHMENKQNEQRGEKTGLLAEGGGMKCAYGAGVLDVFLDEGIVFDYCAGVSAGAANLVSYQAGQRDRNRRFYCVHAQDPRYISTGNFLRTGSLFGLSYIYGELSCDGGADPVAYDMLVNNPSELVFPATDAYTGKARYFTKEDLKRNHYEPLMATCALPVMCRPVAVGDGLYFDGGVSDSLPVEKMMRDGCEKIVVIFSKPSGYLMEPQGMRRVYTAALRRRFPKMVEALNCRHQGYNESMNRIRQLEKTGKAFTFAPAADIKIGTYTTDPRVIQKLYDNGVSDAKKRMGELKAFLEINGAQPKQEICR